MQQFVLTRLSVMMFLEFFIWGAWYVTVGNYMKAHGMFDQVAWAYTVGPIGAIISPFFLGMVADRFFSSERVLGALHLLGAVAMFSAPFAAAVSPTAFIVALFIHMLCYMPTLGLTNSLAFHNIQDQEKQFPVVRVFGTIGWIAANWVVSKGFHADYVDTQFWITGIAATLLGVYSFSLPHTPPPAAGKKVSIGEIAGVDALRLMKEPSFAVFIVCSFLICIPLAAYYAFAPVYAGKVLPDASLTANLKAATSGWLDLSDIGFTMSFGQISEIVFMLLMPVFFIRLGVKYMLLVGMLAWVVRYGLFAGADNADVGWMVLIGILLHGICYDFFFVTGFIYTDKKCSKQIRGQAQGMLVLVTQGLGLGLGAQIMGRIVAANTPAVAADLQQQSAALSKQAFGMTDANAAAPLFERANELGNQASAMVNWEMIWFIPCVTAAVIMVIFALFFRDKVVVDEVNKGDVAEANPQE